jgi:hypothetical protein
MSKILTSWHVKLLSLNFPIVALGWGKEEITCGYHTSTCEVLSTNLI